MSMITIMSINTTRRLLDIIQICNDIIQICNSTKKKDIKFKSSFRQGFQNWTSPGGWTVKTRNWDEN